ncbi:hypothetical protein TD95_000584 [Thielaviopsis punctulata]|uniref:Sodium/calcium exchanger membrane region domain-containing protein n=1 Tax=Thielaviopsis punctulata TaxID=72032 RepID=A0A0F4ZLU2_9PEZI|nr:hypothetical protein TD95_000584 [Thielaviopsis punctulata]
MASLAGPIRGLSQIHTRASRRRPPLRPFVATVASISALASFSAVSHLLLPNSRGGFEDDGSLSFLSRRTTAQPECRDVIYATDTCAFVQQYCADEMVGLVPYLSLYYCSASFLRPFNFALLVSWLGLLFTTIGIAASDFFSVNLATISSLLGLSQNLAGVTFLALGNGSPDVFSTFAAINSGSASMAIGELIGAASFITTVVAGSMALVREFRVARNTFVRDIGFFILAVFFTTCFLIDGKLVFWECCAMIAYYALYVVCVVTWHWYEKRQIARRAAIKAAQGASIAFEPYTDAPRASAAGPPLQGPASPVNALPTTPLLETQMWDEEADEEDDTLENFVAAEISSNMRVLRAPGRRRNTLTPIRPSLVGALEFRSDLARVKKELDPLQSDAPRRQSSHARCWSATDLEGIFSDRSRRSRSPSSSGPRISLEHSPLSVATSSSQRPSISRGRALSSGDRPLSTDLPVIISPPVASASSDNSHKIVSEQHSRRPSPERPYQHSRNSSTASFQVDGNLAPPPIFQHQHQHQHQHQQPQSGHSSPRRKPLTPSALPKLRIPSPLSQAVDAESPLSPFPGLGLSPVHPSPTIPEEEPVENLAPASPLPVPTLMIENENSEATFVHDSNNHRFWPQFLPPPHRLYCTLFPTLQQWGSKGYWDRFVSIVTVPSIFFLVITLPVAEGELMDDEEYEITSIYTPARPVCGSPQSPQSPMLGNVPSSPSLVCPVDGENEWQRYRRYSMTRPPRRQSSAVHSNLATPVFIAIDSPANTRSEVRLSGPAQATPVDAAALSLKIAETQEQQAEDEEVALAWSRWLVGLQIFTGPAFFLLVLWLNMMDDVENPAQTLNRMLGLGAVFSVCMFGLFLVTTEHDVRPRYHSLLSFLGFLVSIAWISTIAGEVVGVLKAVGVIMEISEALLGLTVFAAGNSVGDLVADVTIARLGYPVMALAACFGGPMLNILLGIGLGGVMMMYRKAHHNHKHHRSSSSSSGSSSSSLHYKPIKVQVGGALLISAIGLLFTLVALLIVVPANKWVLSRRIGQGLIALWVLTTAVNVVLEVLGYIH